jgi:hypothetical protein
MQFQDNEDPSVEPFALNIAKFLQRSGNSRARAYELLRNGELESYLEGSHRKITMRSIKAREERLLAAAGINSGLGRDITKRRSPAATADAVSASPPATSRTPSSKPPSPTHAAE